MVERRKIIVSSEKQGLLIDDLQHERKDIIYARVLTHQQEKRGDLDRQIEAAKVAAIQYNVQNLLVKADIGSGLNDNRKQLKQVLTMVQRSEVNRIFVLSKDRLTRFGFNYLKQLCDFHNVEIVVLSDERYPKLESEALAEDVIALIHSFSGKQSDLKQLIKESFDDTNET